MTHQEHPITPPSELVDQWINDGPPLDQPKFVAHYVATQAARWGSDQELEECCALLLQEGAWPWPEEVARLRTARRPKLPSLKEQAKFAAAVLRSPDETCSIAELQQHWHTICNALEALPNG